MNATSGSSNALTNTAVSPAATIPTLTQSYTAANFPINSWGYTGGLDKSSETGGYNCTGNGSSTDNYCPILAYNADPTAYSPNHTIKVTDGPSANSPTTLTFGARANTDKPSGTYTSSVTFTAVANAVPAPAMQDFTASACANATTDETFVLRDSRDDKEYNIAKLQDGNCWMTQNLALGGDTAMTLTQTDSNVGPNGFTLPASVAEGEWSDSEDNPEFYSSNLYWTGEICNEEDPETGDWVCPSGNSPVTDTGPQAYRLGNYYNWPAATAGSGNGGTTGNAPYSICPKGWRLPNGHWLRSEQKTLINTYPALSTPNVQQFTAEPLSLILSGWYVGSLIYQGSTGYWWSYTAECGTGVENLQVDISPNVYVDPEYGDRGYSVRCLIPGS